MRASPDSDKYSHDSLNAMRDSIGRYHEHARAVLDGEEDEVGRNHYGELQLFFRREDGDVVAQVFVNYLIRQSYHDFFTVEDGSLADNEANDEVREVVGRAVEPLGMDDIDLVEDEDLVPSGSGWSGFVVEEGN